MILLAVDVFGINFLVLPHLGTEFVPEINQDNVITVGELPPGTALEAADRAAKRWENAAARHESFS